MNHIKILIILALIIPAVGCVSMSGATLSPSLQRDVNAELMERRPDGRYQVRDEAKPFTGTVFVKNHNGDRSSEIYVQEGVMIKGYTKDPTGEIDGKLYNGKGILKSFYPNGKLRTEAHYYNSQPSRILVYSEVGDVREVDIKKVLDLPSSDPSDRSMWNDLQSLDHSAFKVPRRNGQSTTGDDIVNVLVLPLSVGETIIKTFLKLGN